MCISAGKGIFCNESKCRGHFFPLDFISTAVFLPIHFINIFYFTQQIIFFRPSITFRDTLNIYVYYFCACYQYTISYCVIQKGKQSIKKIFPHGVTHCGEQCSMLKKMLKIDKSHILE